MAATFERLVTVPRKKNALRSDRWWSRDDASVS